MFFNSAPTKTKAIDDQKGIIEAYVSIFNNVDHANDVIIKGAFSETLKRKMPKVVWSHDWQEVIGKVIEAREDDKGLYVKIQLVLDVQRAAEVYALIKAGAVDEFSIGYSIDESEIRDDGVKVLKVLTVYEVSPVLVGCNPKTEVVSVKGVDNNAKNKGSVVDTVNTRKKREQKWEKFVEASKIFDAFWTAYFEENVEVAEFDAMLLETIELLRGLIAEDVVIDAEQKKKIIATISKKMQPNRHVEAKTMQKNGEVHNSTVAIDKPEKVEDGKAGKKNGDATVAQIAQKELRKAAKAVNFTLHVLKSKKSEKYENSQGFDD